MKDYNSNIWKLKLYYFFSALEFTLAIYALFLLDNGLSMTEVMILESVFTLFVFFTEVPSGAFADRVGRKWSLFIAGIAGSLAFALFGLGHTFWIFLIAQILVGIGWAFNTGADSALLYDGLKEMKREKEFSKIYGGFYFIVMGTFALMGILSGFMAKNRDYRFLYFISAFFFLLQGITALTLKEPPIHKHLQEKNYFNHLKKAISFSMKHKVVRNLIIYFGTFAAIGHLTYLVIQPYFKNSGFTETAIGFAMFFYFGSAAIGSLMANYFIKKIKEKRLLFSLLFVGSISLITLFFINKYLSLIFLGLLTFSEGIRNIFIDKEINKHTKSHHRATVISVKSMSKNVIYTFTAPLFGLITDTYTPEATFLMMGITLTIFLIYIVWLFGWNSKGEIKS